MTNTAICLSIFWYGLWFIFVGYILKMTALRYSLNWSREIVFAFSFRTECYPATFKSDIGNKPCIPCGRNSVSLKTNCLCKPDHHRAIGEAEDGSAYCYSKFYIFER